MTAALCLDEHASAEAALLPVAQLAVLLQAYQDQLARLAYHTDPAWLGNLPDGGVTAGTQERAARLRTQLGLAPVRPDAFTLPAHRLALLEKPQLMAVLAARALYAHRVALCRCVDGAVLAQFRAMVGPHALSALRAAAGPESLAAPMPAHGTLADWAAEGYLHFTRDGAWREPSLQRLIQLALPAAATGAPVVGASGDSDALIALLPTLFPELAWLFG
ncbi:type III secretion protein HrpB4 [Duganella sp.]|uniref:type III secretion protein HrpB4 n=1 Tax=Duganella sp. TaxID=1904440 RepID=UPI0031E348D2